MRLGNCQFSCPSGSGGEQIGLLFAGHTGLLGADADLVNIGKCLGQGKRTFTRRIDQPLVGVAVGNQHGGRHLEQIARHEIRVGASLSSSLRVALLPA